MHVASGDRFVSFKAGGDHRDDIFFFLSRGVSHGWNGGVLLDLCQLFSSMHDCCFLPYMWPQVIDLFPSKQAEIAGMAVSFSIARGIAWPEERSDPKKKSHKKIVLLLVFLFVGD